MSSAHQLLQRLGGAPRRWLALVPALISLASLACTTDEFLSQARIPGSQTHAIVTLLAERGDYLDTQVETGTKTYRFFLPDSEECRALVDAKMGVDYQQLGVFGRLTSGEFRCDPIGVLSLRAWRDQRPQSGNRRETIPRAQANWKEIYRDADMVILRGRFPLVSYIGISGGADTLVAVPIEPLCNSVVDKGVGSMEFRVSGKNVLSLVAPDGLCPVLGVIRVTGETQAAAP